MRVIMILISVMFLSIGFGYGQKIKFNKNKVLVDGVEFMDCKFGGDVIKTELTLFEPNSDVEVAFIRWDGRGTPKYSGDDYNIYQFPQADLVLETKSIRTWGDKVKWLLENKVIIDGKLNTEKAKAFVKRYDENITNRTIILE